MCSWKWRILKKQDILYLWKEVEKEMDMQEELWTITRWDTMVALVFQTQDYYNWGARIVTV